MISNSDMSISLAEAVSARDALPHPLLTTLEQVQRLEGRTSTIALAPEGNEWVSMQNLVNPTGELLRDRMDRLAASYKTDKRRVAASFFFGKCAYTLLSLVHACYLLAQRVPRLSLDSVWLCFDEGGEVVGIALRDYHFAALVDDPAVGHMDCTPLPSADALQAYLLEQAVVCLNPFAEAVRAHSPLGIPAMWALAADYSASAAVYVGRGMDAEAAAIEYARELAARPSPLQRKRDFIHVEECGLHFDMVDRLSCCLYYQVGEGEYCSQCPHLPKEQRVERIRQWLAETAAGQSRS